MSRHVGSNFDDFLSEEGIRADVELLAAKKLSAPPPPVCGYVGIDEDESGKLVFGGPCGKPATHDKACGSNGEPVCAGHICRCSVTLEERARRDEAQRVPSHWMAL